MERRVLTREELWIIHIAPLFLGLAIVVTTWFVPFVDMDSGGFYVYRGYPFYWFITAGYGKILLEFRLFSLIADIAVWTAVSSIGTLGILALKTRLKVTRKLSIWILHLAPLTLAVIITLLTWFVVSTYLPKTRMPIFTTYRGYPLPWLVGFGNPGEEPLASIFQLEYFIADVVFCLVVASIGASVIYFSGWISRKLSQSKRMIMKRRPLVALILALVIVFALAYEVQLATRPTPTAPKPMPLSFEEALAAARNPSKPIEKWMNFQKFDWIDGHKQTPHVSADGSVGYYLYRAANGTLFEATYPSGEVGGAVLVVIVPEDKESYYVWEIMDNELFYVDARTGEVLFVAPGFNVIIPFSVDLDTNSSFGFERKWSGPGLPAFEISRGKSATIAVVVTSQCDQTVNALLTEIEGLPSEVEAKLEPERFTLQPHARVTLRLTITVSPTAPTTGRYDTLALWLNTTGKGGHGLATHFLLSIV